MLFFVYIMRGGGYIKVGQSKDVVSRLRHFNRGHLPFLLDLVCYTELPEVEAFDTENYLINEMPNRTIGEWSKDTGASDSALIDTLASVLKRLELYHAPIISAAVIGNGEPHRGRLGKQAMRRAIDVMTATAELGTIGKPLTNVTDSP